MAQINKPNTYFNTKLYTGNGSTNAITGVGFQPDMVWTKRRSGVDNHHLFDAVRVISSVPQRLFPNLTNAEDGNFGSLDSFDADGFTLGANVATNASGQTFASWNFKAGGTGVSNTQGSITSTVSANTTSGFSIVSWTGTGANATVGHGLTSAPQMIILKNRDSAENWIVGNTSLGWTKYLALNLTDATTTASNIWQNTAPTSSVFSIGDSGKVNGSGNGIVAYCFAEKKGFSKFGKYTGNGSADGTFVYTGFKPAFVMIKRDGSGENWTIRDNKRDGFNITNKTLKPNTSDAEASTSDFDIDLLSNGFKLRSNSGHSNSSGQTNIYMAFAENPLVGTNNIPTTAR